MLAFFQFVIIVIDRVLYLRRSILSKAVLQVFTLVLFFGLFFFDMRSPKLAASPPFVTALFALKCHYWIFSARQVRLGYPKGLDMHAQSANYFFHDFSFRDLLVLKLPPPFKPQQETYAMVDGALDNDSEDEPNPYGPEEMW